MNREIMELKTNAVYDAQLSVVEEYRRAMFECVIRSLVLEEIVEYVASPQFDTHLSYHNTWHCARTALRAWELAMLEREVEGVALLIVACLFHDFGHTGKRPDSNNIEIAVNGMRGCQAVQDRFSQPEIRGIEQLIRVTEFPFVHEPNTPFECIIRDADLMEGFEPFHIQAILYDLRKELVGVQGEIGIKEAVRLQEKFVASVEMYTEAGNTIWERTKPFTIESMRRHAEITE